MTRDAKTTKVLQTTVPTALHNRHNVVDVPKPARPVGRNAMLDLEVHPRLLGQQLLVLALESLAIEAAESTDALVPLPHEPGHPRARPHHPEVHALLTAEGLARRLDLLLALAALCKTCGSPGEVLGPDTATLDVPGRLHTNCSSIRT